MTTLKTYRAALEHIRDGSDAVCTECGWMGNKNSRKCVPMLCNGKPSGVHARVCPNCGKSTFLGIDKIAAYALAQGDKG